MSDDDRLFEPDAVRMAPLLLILVGVAVAVAFLAMVLWDVIR